MYLRGDLIAKPTRLLIYFYVINRQIACIIPVILNDQIVLVRATLN